MTLNIKFIVLGLFVTNWLNAQTITGNLPLLASQTIQLKGFNGFKDYDISSTKIDSVGNFMLKYQPTDFGMGFLLSSDEKPYILILSGEDIALAGEALSYTETIKTTQGRQNQLFEQYAVEHPKREQSLNAWDYLEKIYLSDSLFSTQKVPLKSIQTEQQRIKSEDVAFLNNLPQNSYVRWFLPVRKLVSSVSTVAQYRPQEIPATIAALRQIDYADPRLYKSGLFKEALENHVWLIEKSSGELDKVYADLNISIDIIINQLKSNPKRFNEVTDYLFNLLEKRSLFKSAEYLALKVLGDQSCSLDANVTNKLESYRAMKTGNVAPDIEFGALTKFNIASQAQTLKQLNADLKLVVFAASWCSHCQEIMSKIAANYLPWKAKGMEVIVVSLDSNQQEYEAFTKQLPFITTTDLKVWEGQAAKEYHVFATPTMFVLDKDLEILLKPISVEQINSWFEYVYN